MQLDKGPRTHKKAKTLILELKRNTLFLFGLDMEFLAGPGNSTSEYTVSVHKQLFHKKVEKWWKDVRA